MFRKSIFSQISLINAVLLPTTGICSAVNACDGILPFPCWFLPQTRRRSGQYLPLPKKRRPTRKSMLNIKPFLFTAVSVSGSHHFQVQV
ncbi:hypothetical protein BC830DRAFT_425314 [Chytriomyces sp. MP71]|nr:hypothetical protein BC830DRAFT_425314 [Chytriomyces sp. MP71]